MERQISIAYITYRLGHSSTCRKTMTEGLEGLVHFAFRVCFQSITRLVENNNETEQNWVAAPLQNIQYHMKKEVYTRQKHLHMKSDLVI